MIVTSHVEGDRLKKKNVESNGPSRWSQVRDARILNYNACPFQPDGEIPSSNNDNL